MNLGEIVWREAPTSGLSSGIGLRYAVIVVAFDHCGLVTVVMFTTAAARRHDESLNLLRLATACLHSEDTRIGVLGEAATDNVARRTTADNNTCKGSSVCNQNNDKLETNGGEAQIRYMDSRDHVPVHIIPRPLTACSKHEYGGTLFVLVPPRKSSVALSGVPMLPTRIRGVKRPMLPCRCGVNHVVG